jgi:probable DNA metabolism protein
MDYLYDGSFDGLLTCIYHSYYSVPATGIYLQDNYQYSLINPFLNVQTEPNLASRVYAAISEKISEDTLNHVYYVFLSNHLEKGNLIHSYIRLGFKIGPSVNSLITHPNVLPILQTSRKVSFEAHRFEGLLRFSDIGKFLYAIFEPDHNIVILLADFFADRLKHEHFIIHDRKRNIAAIYNTHEWYLSDFSSDIKFQISDEENFYQQLWSKYFAQIGIENRKNPRLQAQFVPHRYRHNLPEFKSNQS